jgi:dolichol-phosphate mannosyltransferase
VKLSVSVIMPALNEEKNIIAAVDNTLKAFDDYRIEGEIVVINDGSTDSTGSLVSGRILQDKRIRIITHDKPRGIGTCFWEGAVEAKYEVVSVFPGDNENDPWETLRYLDLLEHVDIVIPFVFNREVRPPFRNFLSFVYRTIVNTTFLVNFNYTNGTVLYRKIILDDLTHQSAGFFYQTENLIRLVKRGYLFAEVPYRLGTRRSGISKAVSFPSFLKVCKGYLKLVKSLHLSPYSPLKKSTLNVDSVSSKRISTVKKDENER